MSPLTEPTRLTLAKGQPVPNDPYFAFNSLLLHGNGSNGSTVITDSSGSPKEVAPIGSAQISTAVADPFGNSTGVLAFDGNGDYLQSSTNAQFALGTDDFTLEAWIYPVGFSAGPGSNNFGPIFDFRTANVSQVNVLLTFLGSSTLVFFVNGVTRITGTSIPTSSWTHVALCRSSGTTRLFIGGSQAGSSYSDSNNYTSSVFRSAGNISGNAFFNGYIDDLRITKGVARYTSNFTPPTAPFPDF